MGNKKIVHWNMDNIDAENADINLIYGERSNGKSYQVKHKKAVIKYLKTKKRFILMRRWKEEISASSIEQYFKDVDVEKLTDGRYNTIIVWSKKIYLARYEVGEDGSFKVIKGEYIGYVVALSTEQNYAGASYLDVEDIIFEEFMSRSQYIANESTKLMNFYCTVDRKRGTTRLWLVGNSISRVCPYIEDWGLHEIISRQKQGTIVTKEIPSAEDDVVKIAIEYCSATGVSSHTIGNTKMLSDGSWQTFPQPHLEKSLTEYNCLYKFIFMFKSFKFIASYLQDKTEHDKTCWFIKPYDGKINDKTLVISDTIKVSKYWQRDIYNISIKNDKLQNLLNTFKENNIFYSDDLCGTDFKQVIDFTIRK